LSLKEWDKRDMREQQYKQDVVCVFVCVHVCMYVCVHMRGHV